MDKWLDLIRGLVRPVLTFVIIGTLVMLTIRLSGEFADEEVAKALIYFFSGSGTMLLGYWFGERKRRT